MVSITAQRVSRVMLVPVLCWLEIATAGTGDPATSSGVEATTAAAGNLHSGYLVQLVVGLLFVLLCIVALAWVAKRINRFQASSDGALQVLGGISMGARERVVLVQVGTTQLLLGVAPGRINMLHQLEQPLEQNNTKSDQRRDVPIARGFSEKLNSALSRYK